MRSEERGAKSGPARSVEGGWSSLLALRSSLFALLLLTGPGLAEERWWQDIFRAEDAPSPRRPEVTDPLEIDAELDRGGDAYRGLLWMNLVTEAHINLADVFDKETELLGATGDVVAALLMKTPAQDPSGTDRDDRWRDSQVWTRDDWLDLDDVRTIVTRYQESQGRRPEGVVIGQTMVMPAVFDSGEPVSRWMDRHVLPVLPDMVVEWGRDMDLTERISWSFERNSMSGEPTLLDRHVEESVKQVDFRVGRSLHFELGFRRELLNSQPEDDLFEGGSGASEPFASLMWKF